MKSASLCVVVAATAAFVCCTVARAESDAEYLHPGVPPKAASPFGRGAPPPVPAVRRAGNPAMFAPAAAAGSRRLSEQQREEWRFLKHAAAAGRFESEASRLALARSNHPGVRTFAATLVNHHTSAGNELVHMLHVRGMAPPMLANAQRKALNRLAKLQGARFDREYIDEVGLKTQQEDVQAFEKAKLGTRDPQLQAWIARTLPTLRYHVTLAERLSPNDARLGRAVPAANAGRAFDARLPVAQPLTADPFVSRASLATRSMGASTAPLGLSTPAPGRRPSESSTR
jgi:predicted outer membrane protein